MERDRRLSLLVGGFVLACLGVLAGVIVFLSSERGVWKPSYRLVTHFDNVQGLNTGAPVWLAGKDVGSVASVTFGEIDGERGPVRVQLQIDTDVRERIRSDSSASIGTIGLLGDRYVEISLGTPAGTPLADGAELAAREPLSLDDVVQKGTQALDNIASLATNLNLVVEDFGAEMGGRKAAETVTAIRGIIEEVRTGEGLLHSMIYDRYEGGGIDSIQRSLATLEEILTEVRSGRGILHTLIYEPPAEQDLVMQAIEAGARLNSILEKIDRGEGTMGLLLNDPTVYEDLKLLLGGAQRSRVLRTLISLSRDGPE